MEKNGKKFVRKLNPDRNYIAPDGSNLQLSGRSLLEYFPQFKKP